MAYARTNPRTPPQTKGDYYSSADNPSGCTGAQASPAFSGVATQDQSDGEPALAELHLGPISGGYKHLCLISITDADLTDLPTRSTFGGTWFLSVISAGQIRGSASLFQLLLAFSRRFFLVLRNYFSWSCQWLRSQFLSCLCWSWRSWSLVVWW